MPCVLQRTTDGYFYRGRNKYPSWCNDVMQAKIYLGSGPAKVAMKWSSTQEKFLEIKPVSISII